MGSRSGSQKARPVSRRGITVLVAVFLVVISAIVGLAAVGLEVLTSVRAYVGGEGLWSKAEKDAASALSSYIAEGNEAYYREFLRQLAVPLGDRQAREELERPRPDLAIARAGFLQGRNHPADVDGMSRLFVRFRRVEPLERALGIWQRGDVLIAQLAKVGEDVHARTSAGRLTEEERRSFLEQVEVINGRVTILEDAFSATLGEAARWVRDALQRAMLAMTILLVGVALVASIRIARFLHAQEDSLRASERRYRQAFEENLAGMYRTTPDGVILECNAAFARLLGRESPDELQGRTFFDLCFDPAESVAMKERASEQRMLVNHEICLRRSDDAPVWVVVNENALENDAGLAVKEGSLVDVTDRRQGEERSRFQASHDPLTGLPNRLLFWDRLSLAMLQAQRHRERLAVMFLDLDHLKEINDGLGHSAGDDVLVKVAERLRSCLRGNDTVARLGGDEFLFLLPDVSKESDVAALARKILALVSEPLTVAGREIHVTASLGLGMYPNDGEDAESLVANVDAAMYRAKERGRNNFQFFKRPAAEAGGFR
ncbi:MAG TPA: sensor domain-containing diguanylate cyclase [Thermoanaerobaculia bacterium]|nr:sensor domain-containing diguanylate cyclase [Thermoanaerobaculia bacterium]